LSPQVVLYRHAAQFFRHCGDLLVVQIADFGEFVDVEFRHDALGNGGTDAIEGHQRFGNELLVVEMDAEKDSLTVI
jgi:hypothetical protein